MDSLSRVAASFIAFMQVSPTKWVFCGQYSIRSRLSPNFYVTQTLKPRHTPHFAESLFGDQPNMDELGMPILGSRATQTKRLKTRRGA
jgi:hypothetical protein